MQYLPSPGLSRRNDRDFQLLIPSVAEGEDKPQLLLLQRSPKQTKAQTTKVHLGEPTSYGASLQSLGRGY